MTFKEAKTAISIERIDRRMVNFYSGILNFLSKAKYPDEEPVKSSIELMKKDLRHWVEAYERDSKEAVNARKAMENGEIEVKTKHFARKKRKEFSNPAMPGNY